VRRQEKSGFKENARIFFHVKLSERKAIRLSDVVEALIVMIFAYGLIYTRVVYESMSFDHFALTSALPLLLGVYISSKLNSLLSTGFASGACIHAGAIIVSLLLYLALSAFVPAYFG